MSKILYSLFFLIFFLCMAFLVVQIGYSHQNCLEASVVFDADMGPTRSPLSSGSTIPHHIHQTWKEREIPPQYQHLVQEIKKLHPTYIYTLWTDEDNLDFVRAHFPWFLPTYMSYEKHIKRADAARYLWLYVHGGVYMDLDSVTLRPLDTLLEGRDMLFGYAESKKNKNNAIPNAFMAIAPRHPFMAWVLKQLPKTKHLDVVYATGPNFLTHCLRQWKLDRYPYVLDMPVLFTHPWHKKISIDQHNLEQLRKDYPQSHVTTFWTHSWK